MNFISSHLQVGVKHITLEPIDLHRYLADAHHPASGALTFFSGEIRNHHKGKAVLALNYESHVALADKMIAAILIEARVKFDLNHAFCLHRIGHLQIGESAVVVTTSATHRKEAYDANQYIIHRVKHEVPIWKKEHYEDGSSNWSDPCQC